MIHVPSKYLTPWLSHFLVYCYLKILCITNETSNETTVCTSWKDDFLFIVFIIPYSLTWITYTANQKYWINNSFRNVSQLTQNSRINIYILACLILFRAILNVGDYIFYKKRNHIYLSIFFFKSAMFPLQEVA